MLYGTAAIQSWRQLLFWLGPPGLAIAGLALLTLKEPREPAGASQGNISANSRLPKPTMLKVAAAANNRTGPRSGRVAAIAAQAARATRDANAAKANLDLVRSVRSLLASSPFQVHCLVLQEGCVDLMGAIQAGIEVSSLYMHRSTLMSDVFAFAGYQQGKRQGQ